MTSTCLPSVYSLARLAGCTDPDNLTSPGARFLLAVAEHVAERAGDDDDPAHEIADAAVPVYTHDLWSTFTDLGLWHVDVTELVEEGADLTRRASIALYLAAERLAAALLAEQG